MSNPARTSIKKRVLPTGSPVSGGAPAGAWVVSLADVPLADVLKRIALEEKSGDLQVISGTIVKTIYFDRGFVVFASSNLEADRIGHRLIQTGHISSNELAAAWKLTAGRNRRLGQALVDAGLMSEEELGRQVAGQVNGIILSLFQLQDAIYSFDERPCAIPVELMVSLSIHRILLEGIRDMTSVELIQKGLPPLDNWVQIAERPPFTMDLDKLTAAEQAVLKAVGRGGALESILQKLSGDELVVLRACYGLYASGIFEPVDPRDTWRPRRVQEETIAFRLSALEKNADHVQAQNVRQEILMEFDRIKRIPDEEALGIYDEADADQIERAYDERSRAWARKREVVEDEPSLASKVDTIQAYLKQARDRFLSTVTSTSDEGAPAAARGHPLPSLMITAAANRLLQNAKLEIAASSSSSVTSSSTLAHATGRAPSHFCSSWWRLHRTTPSIMGCLQTRCPGIPSCESMRSGTTSKLCASRLKTRTCITASAFITNPSA